MFFLFFFKQDKCLFPLYVEGFAFVKIFQCTVLNRNVKLFSLLENSLILGASLLAVA